MQTIINNYETNKEAEKYILGKRLSLQHALGPLFCQLFKKSIEVKNTNSCPILIPDIFLNIMPYLSRRQIWTSLSSVCTTTARLTHRCMPNRNLIEKMEDAFCDNSELGVIVLRTVDEFKKFLSITSINNKYYEKIVHLDVHFDGSCYEIVEDFLSLLQHMPNLKVLMVDGGNLTVCFDLSQNVNLEEMNFTSGSNIVAAIFPKSSKLRKISFPNQRFAANIKLDLSQSSQFPNLQEVNFDIPYGNSDDDVFVFDDTESVRYLTLPNEGFFWNNSRTKYAKPSPSVSPQSSNFSATSVAGEVPTERTSTRVDHSRPSTSEPSLISQICLQVVFALILAIFVRGIVNIFWPQQQ